MKYPNLTEATPMTAPAMTSEAQCLSFMILEMPVAEAIAYPPKLNQGLRQPYSSCNMAAIMKLVAVCPEGKELLEVPSGRGLAAEYFIPLTAIVMMAAENASETAMRPQEVRLSYPPAFNPSSTAAGAYCR